MALLLKKQGLCGVSDNLPRGRGSNARDTIQVEVDDQYNDHHTRSMREKSQHRRVIRK